GFGQRHRGQVGTAVAAATGGAVADGAFFGKDFLAGFGVRRAGRFSSTTFDFFFFFGPGTTGFFPGFAFFGFLTGVLGAFALTFEALRFGHRPVQREHPEVFTVRGGRQRVTTGVDRNFLFAFVFERGDRGVRPSPGLPVPEFFTGFRVVGDEVAVVLADEQEAAGGGH